MTAPVRFCFGVHLHQPVGNFDSVFEQHMEDVYLPFLTKARDAEFLPLTLHVSGPLIEWMEAHDKRYLDLVGDLASSGKLELLLAGMYEPVLACLSREDRVEQIQWMREALHARFGVDARGLWLTERVWESELAADLHDAGVQYALVDDRHFLVSGFSREQLHAPLWTENGGKKLALFPIDERLRYLIPFQPPEQTVAYLRALRAYGHSLAVLADDGEKFGGWPGTRDWVYTRGWLDKFFTALREPIENGEVQLSTFADALANTPSGGLAYLGTASYREMEAWSLPPQRAARLEAIEKQLGEAAISGADGTLIRGSHWRNFLVKYAEANRLHKKMMALSALCRERGDPYDARRAVGRAQCNDSYWHGVFGGLYLPHLRDGVWRQLAIAERLLRANDTLSHEIVDIDGDGNQEVWIHSPNFSAIVAPARGGAVEEWTIFASGINYANALTRRRESSHKIDETTGNHTAVDASAAPSIHDIEQTNKLTQLPPVDSDVRALFVDRTLRGGVTRDAFVDGTYEDVRSWARQPMTFAVQQQADSIVVSLRNPVLHKDITFYANGTIDVCWEWVRDEDIGMTVAKWFSTELSLAGEVSIEAAGAERWTYDIETVARSERGLDRTRQGTAEILRWPIQAIEARVTVRPVINNA